MAESSHSADIFNNRYFGSQSSPAPGTDLEFPLFSQLPSELRLHIWTWHLHHRRFLRVLLEEDVGAQHGKESEHELGDDDDEWAPIFAAGRETRAALLSASPTAPPLRVTFLGDPSPAMPALRRVCRESRDAHNSVYRIRLPALARIHRGYDYKTWRVMAYVNPELDMLSIHTPNPPEIVTLNLLPLFLHHLVQHDFSPAQLRFGARHLAVDLRHLGSDHRHGSDNEGGPAPPKLAPHVLASVRLTVSHLRGLYPRLTTARLLEPRVMGGPFTNKGATPWYNASVPVLPATSWGFLETVEPLPGGDPRLVSQPEEGKADLRQVWIGSELRPSLDVWAGLKRGWGVPAGSEPSPPRVRALVGLDGEGWAEHRVAHGGSISSLGAYLREERAAWRALMDPGSAIGRFQREIFQAAHETSFPSSAEPRVGLVDPEEWILLRQPHTAVGFWLVDPEVLEAAETTGAVGKKIVDLSERVRPEDIELWVFRGHW